MNGKPTNENGTNGITWRQMLQESAITASAGGVAENVIEANLKICQELICVNGCQLSDVVDATLVNHLASSKGDGKAGCDGKLIIPRSANGHLMPAVDMLLRAYEILSKKENAKVSTRDNASPAAPIKSETVAQTTPLAPANGGADLSATAQTIKAPLKRTWQYAFEQVHRESLVRGTSAKATDVTLSVCASFLRANGYDPEDLVDLDFIHEVDKSLATCNWTQNQVIVFPPDVGDDSAFRSRVRSLCRACRALNGPNFFETLSRYLKASQLSYSKIAVLCGLTKPIIRGWMVRRSAGVSNLSCEQVRKLDEVLRADGELVSIYAATNQRSAYETPRTVMDEILDRVPFGTLLKEFRKKTNRTIQSILDEVKKLTKISVQKSQISHWEQGLYRPSLNMRRVMEALDKIYGADGALINAWKLEKPKKILSKYEFSYRDWSQHLRDLFDHLELFKMKNPDQWKTSATNGGDRWTSKATSNRHKAFWSKFFGYLMKEKGIEKKDLSSSLLCHWPFVRGYFDFVTERTGETLWYSYHAYTMSGGLLNLYRFYFAHLAEQAVREPFWRDRLPTHVTTSLPVTPNFTKEVRVKLPNLKARWEYQVKLAEEAAMNFMASARFEKKGLCQRARPLLDADIQVVVAAAELLRQRIEALPPTIECRKMAILFRRLAIAAAMFARAPRTANLQLLHTSQVTIINGNIHLEIPEKDFKQRGKGGSEGGWCDQLSDISWINLIFKRYLEEARPILLGPVAGGGTDEGYFFIAAHSNKIGTPGEKLSAALILHDAVLTLGYNPYSQRYIAASEGLAQGKTTEEMANYLMNTSETVDIVYAIRTAGRCSRRANRTGADLVTPSKPAHKNKGHTKHPPT